MVSLSLNFTTMRLAYKLRVNAALCEKSKNMSLLTVEIIGKEEAALQEKMPNGGYIEDRNKYLNENKLYDEWRDLYTKYVRLAQDGDIEALKRAVFYAWYQLSEPGWLSGISELPDHETQIVVNLLETYLSKGSVDEELKQMLPYYMVVCSYYLERFYPLPHIQKASIMGKDLGRPPLVSSQWEYRGQMGEYWGE